MDRTQIEMEVDTISSVQIINSISGTSSTQEMQQVPKKGHPKGLYVLFATEMWERFSYYGMRAILVLFMTKALMYDKAFASNLYGSYTGLVYLTPLIGGYIADRLWGNQRSIITGGLLMAFGQFLLFFCGTTYHTSPHLSTFLFFAGLGFLIAGNGFFKPNISSMVGQLYPKDDRRIDAAYTIFYMGINVGGGLGPLVCGALGDTSNPADFRWGFMAAGIGMLLSILIFKKLKDKFVISPEGKTLGLTPTKADGTAQVKTSQILVYGGLLALSIAIIGLLYIDATKFGILSYLLITAVLGIGFMIFSDRSLNRVDKQRIGVIFITAFFVIFFWSAFEQAGASLTFFAEEQTQRNLGWYTIPASFFQSLNSLFIIIFAPFFAFLWVKLGNRGMEPSSPTKMALGLFLLALGYLVIAYGVKGIQPSTKVSMMWLTSMYALHTYGELCLSPIGLSLVNKLSPLRFGSLLMAVWFLANAAANKMAGVLSALYPDPSKPAPHLLGFEITGLYEFFMLFVFMAGIASITLFTVTKYLQTMMHNGE